MGGTGVAVAHPATANSANPAMLAAKHHDWKNDYGMIIPSINARLADDEDVVDQVDAIQDDIDRYDNLISSGASAQEIEAAAGELHDKLEALDGDVMRADVGAGFSFAVPNDTLSVGIFSDATMRAGVKGNVADTDLAQLEAVSNGNQAGTQLDGNLDSSGRALASAVIEAGISFGRSFDVGMENPVQFGVTPKYVQLRTYQYTAVVNDFEEDDSDEGDYETTKSGFNMDLGAAYSFGEDRQWRAGLAIKNVIPMELDSKYDTTKGEREQTLKLNPMVTAGIAQTTEYYVVTAEAELTKREAFGYGDDTQWISVGAELDAWRYAQLRVGARHNIASNDDGNGVDEDTQLTAGIGLMAFGARLDVGGMVSGDEVGGSVELGVAF